MLENQYQYDLPEAGCDEAGRGCLAGPVFAAAVMLPPDFHDPLLNDSKQMSERNREKLRAVIEREAVAWAVEAVSAARIDEINILNASFEGMSLAVARDVVLPRLPEFMQAHPELEIELSSTDRRVDLIREGFDCVLRVGTLADSSLIARPIGEYRMLNVASPAYLERYGVPQTIADLAGHRLIHYVSTLGGRSPGFEYVDTTAPTGAAATLFQPMAGALTVNNSDSYLGACLAGLGIIQSPEVGLQRWIDAGRLVEVLPDYRPSPMPVSLLYANRRHLPRRVRAFMTWIEKLIRERLA